MSKLVELVGVLKAVSEPTRLRMLALMVQGELSVKDICDILGQSQPRVSRHLKLLADVGLAKRHAEGAWAYYRLADTAFVQAFIPHLLPMLDTGDPMVSADATRLAEVREAQAELASSYFAKVADSWDMLRGLHVAESDIEAAILEIAAKRPVGHVLDLGTGTGRMLELLSPYFRTGTGIDFSREMAAVARAKLAAAQIGHAQIRIGDISEPVDAPGAADLVILHQVLHYFDDPGRVLSEAARACGQCGRVLVIDFAPHKHEFLRNENAHRRLGLSDEQMRTWARNGGLFVSMKREFTKKDAPEALTVCLWVLEHVADQAEGTTDAS